MRVMAVLLPASGTLFVRSQGTLQLGYATVTAEVGAPLPVGVALFSFTNASGVLVSQAGAGAVEPVTSGRIFVDEVGTKTGIAIVNPSPQSITVSLILRDASGRVGYAVLTPDAGTASPSGTAIFQYTQGNFQVTEAGVAAASETTQARIFVDNVGTSTGIAVANPAAQAAEVTFRLLDRYGVLLDTATRTIPARNHIARFAHELFPGLSSSFTGLIEIGSTQPATVIALRLTVNSRGEQVLTTLPVADMTRLTSATSMTFPHVVNGQGYSTRLLFINTAGRTAAGQLSFYESSGAAMVTSLAGKPGTGFSYQIAGGGGRQFLPWNTEKVAGIELIDAFSNRPAREVVVNEGNKAPVTLRVLDSSGSVRDDFDVSHTSLSPDVAAIDPATGLIEGKKAGFSTLTVESGGVVSTGTITVVRIDAGVAGFGITGIAQDLSRRLYLASTSEHTILRTESLQQAPQPYAGVAKTPGLKNDVRDQALFRNPAFLAFDQSEGNLFVADAANHVIRKVWPGVSGRVETLAGTGEAGSKDGSQTESNFRNPQGVQLDARGNLWVADTGNHTVRRINLRTEIVETIAGKAGSSGLVDGTKDAARFNSPRGIALETESLEQQLARERRGEPPPPVSLLVADTGNGVIRRVSESGHVQTIGSGGASTAVFRSSIAGSVGAPSAPALFDSPEGIAVDSSGNVFVTEPGTGRVKAVLPTGEVVAAAQAGTFRSPKGLAITQTGRVVVAESDVSAREIVFGKPRVTSITPNRVSDRGGAVITIKGKNFAPDTRVVIVGKLPAAAKIVDTETISATVPALPNGAGADTSGNLLIADRANGRIRKVSANGIITTIAGNGSDRPPMDNVLATEARLTGPSAVLGAATAAQLQFPRGLALGRDGTLFVADTYNSRIRAIKGVQ